MGWFFGIATYVMIWWLVIFTVLPWGLRPAQEDDAGHGAGAPANPRLWLKAGITTAVATVIWLLVYWAVSADLISFGL